jgi:hypothetical protein
LSYKRTYYQQQIGNDLVDSGGTFNGFIFGDGTLTNGNFIKFDDGTYADPDISPTFIFGDNVKLNGKTIEGDKITFGTAVKAGTLNNVVGSYVYGIEFISPTSPSTEYFILADSTNGTYTQGLKLATQGLVKISNTNNELYFDPASSGTNSYLKMNNEKFRVGKDAVSSGNDGFYISTTGTTMSLNTTTPAFNLTTTGTINISNTNNQLLFAPTGTTSYIKLATGGSEGYFSVGNTSSNEFMEYNTDFGLEVQGKFINGVAYVSSALEFLGAIYTTSDEIVIDGEFLQNPFYSKTVSGIIVTDYISIALSNNKNLTPNTNLRFIESNNGLKTLKIYLWKNQ